MSAPTKELGNLSLGSDMSSTRLGSQNQRQKPPYTTEDSSNSESEEESSSSESEEEEEEDDDDDDSPLSSAVTFPGKSSIVYDLQMLSRGAKAKARHGLSGEFSVDKCRPIYGGGYDFDIIDHGRVYVGEGPITCSCLDFQGSRIACRHIYWLVDQLHRRVLTTKPSGALKLSPNGECDTLDPMLELIGDRMENICQKVKWSYIPTPGTPPDTQCSSISMSRPEKARDLLSAFSADTLPDEFRPELVETIRQPRTPEQCVVQGDFEATMFRLAVHDENVYASLRKVMPSGARAAIFFDKVQRRVRSLLTDFNRYRLKGTPRQSDHTALEVDIVADEMRDHLRLIQKNIISRSPHGFKGAAETLLYLLRAVCQFNFDAFEASTWERPSEADETAEDRNLYLQLIYNPLDGDDFFVLSCLEQLPEDVLQNITPQLDNIFSDMQVNAAPVPYLRKLHSIIAGDLPAKAAVGATLTSSASGQKRPSTAASGSGRKRTK
ncbi:hypothetical protein MGYG_04831 [Nannizzia gypsea CBS 118893]|uniref:SWIM-type domain-containing protein n=1 Tax=Arthroderma gypseum (strain ATCC MYA-4604 / CBS 118893) TaxID=535722 RepID=E4UX32_ARTGP|nr:hypothetical protein MGYG_04831 [Nannizzia gypsea CBS 118893]EFR01832.1 hypothetical protein MGYG_04831 [Nannizzia gypsea CBS 118893]